MGIELSTESKEFSKALQSFFFFTVYNQYNDKQMSLWLLIELSSAVLDINCVLNRGT